MRLVQKFVGSQPDRVPTIWLIAIHACDHNKRLYNQQLMFIGSNRWQSEYVLTSKCKGGCYHSSTIQSKTVTILPHPHGLCLVKPSHRHKSVLEVSPFRHCSFCIFAGLKLYDQCRSCFIPNMINNFPKLLKMSHMHLIINSIIFTYRFPNTCFRLVVQTCNYYQLYYIIFTLPIISLTPVLGVILLMSIFWVRTTTELLWLSLIVWY